MDKGEHKRGELTLDVLIEETNNELNKTLDKAQKEDYTDGKMSSETRDKLARLRKKFKELYEEKYETPSNEELNEVYDRVKQEIESG